MRVVPFDPSHLEILELQESQQLFRKFFDKNYGPALQASGPCFTAIDDGQVLICAGAARQWDNRAIAWSLISAHAGRQFVRIHKAVTRFLETTDFNRIEAFVDADFEQAHRWIEMLGFQREGYMRQFTPDGRDSFLYARLKNG